MNPDDQPADFSMGAPVGERIEALQRAVLELLEIDPRQALELAGSCLRLAEEAGDQPGKADSLLLLGRALVAQSELPEARQKLLAASELYRQLGHRQGEAEAQTHLGRVHLNLGQFVEAGELLRRAIGQTSEVESPGARVIQATALNLLAGTYYQQGEAGEALQLLHQALQLWQQEENITGQVQCLSNIGNIQTSLGQYGDAISTLSTAYKLYRTHPYDVPD